MSEGRNVPWAKDEIVWNMSGGLIPGETLSARFLRAKDGDAESLLREEAGEHCIGGLSRWWAVAP